MRDNLTEIVFILDRSGSMSGLTDDTIGGFNSFIEQQKKVVGEAKLTTVLFDDRYELLHNGVDINEVKPLTRDDYSARGMTALYDAIGKTINDVGDRLSKTPEDDRPSKVIVVITTDGAENSSVEFSQSKIKEMITHQTEKYNWEFIFLGANIDSVAVGDSIGIAANRSANYSASDKGVASVYCAMCDTISTYRNTGTVDEKSLNSLC